MCCLHQYIIWGIIGSPRSSGPSSGETQLALVFSHAYLAVSQAYLAVMVMLQDVEAAKADHQQGRAKGRAGPGQLETLWRVVAEDLLTSSHERKSLAFQLFTILLPNLQ